MTTLFMGIVAAFVSLLLTAAVIWGAVAVVLVNIDGRQSWFGQLVRNRMPRIYSLLDPAHQLSVAFANLEPGSYLLVFDGRYVPLSTIKKIGFARPGAESSVKIVRMVVMGNPRDVVALFEIGEAEIV